jgi:hypothetical protein
LVAALGVIFVLPDAPTIQKYLLASAASVLTIVVPSVYFGWDRIIGLPKSRVRELVLGVQTIFYFYTAYLFWSIVPPLWGATPVVGGYYVVTWFQLFLVVILVVGAITFYMAIINIKNWYLWRRDLQKKKRRSRGQSALSP